MNISDWNNIRKFILCPGEETYEGDGAGGPNGSIKCHAISFTEHVEWSNANARRVANEYAIALGSRTWEQLFYFVHVSDPCGRARNREIDDETTFGDLANSMEELLSPLRSFSPSLGFIFVTIQFLSRRPSRKLFRLRRPETESIFHVISAIAGNFSASASLLCTNRNQYLILTRKKQTRR
jgi:hypothetical protein